MRLVGLYFFPSKIPLSRWLHLNVWPLPEDITEHLKENYFITFSNAIFKCSHHAQTTLFLFLLLVMISFRFTVSFCNETCTYSFIICTAHLSQEHKLRWVIPGGLYIFIAGCSMTMAEGRFLTFCEKARMAYIWCNHNLLQVIHCSEWRKSPWNIKGQDVRSLKLLLNMWTTTKSKYVKTNSS